MRNAVQIFSDGFLQDRMTGCRVRAWFLAIGFVFSPHLLHGQQGTYVVTDLGSGEASAINEGGHVVGFQLGSCFIYDGKAVVTIRIPNALSASCNSIDNRDQVAGSELKNGQVQAFSYDSLNGVIELGTLGGGISTATAINNAGVIVGASTIKGTPPDNDTLQRAFVFTGGKMSTLPGLSSAYSQAVGINTSGQIAGVAQLTGAIRGFIYDNGSITPFDPPAGFLGIGVLGIADSGHVIVSSTSIVNGKESTPLAFLYMAGAITPIPPLTEGTFNEADGVNSNGEVVGVAATSDGSRHAFLFSGGTAHDLNLLIGAASGDWVLEEATGINANGQIVGYGSLRGQPRAFLLTPGTAPPSPARPEVIGVVNSADFLSPVAIQDLGTVFGHLLSDASTSASTLPFPQKLRNAELFLCPSQTVVDVGKCVPSEMIYVGPTQINFRVPDAVSAAGQYRIVVRVDGQLDADSAIGNPRSVSILPYSLAVFFMGYDCLIDARFQNRDPVCGLTPERKPGLNQVERGAVTDLSGNLLTSANPARLGKPYTIWLTGLGKMTNGVYSGTPGMVVSNIPVYDYMGDTFQNYGSFEFIGPSPQFPGLQQINFVLPVSIATGHSSGYPPMWPCGDYQWEVSLDLYQGIAHDAHLIQIPIVVKRGDVECAPN